MSLFKKPSLDTSSIVQYVDKKAHLFKAKRDHAKHGEHVHYFSKREVNTPGLDPHCKVCGMQLSELSLERKLEAATARFRAARESIKDRIEAR